MKAKFMQYALYIRYCKQCGVTDAMMVNDGMSFDEFNACTDLAPYYVGQDGKVH